MAHLRMSDHNSKLLSRELQARMDNREDHNPVVEACLGYAGAVGVMAMDAMASDGERTDEAMQGIVESVRRVDTCQDEWTALMGTQSGRVDTLAAELVDARETMEELRRELAAERRAWEAMQDLLATSQLEVHMARNGVSCLHRQLRCAGVNIPRDADWPSAEVPALSEAPSPSSTQISAPGTGSSVDDPLEIMPDSEDEEVVQVPAPPQLSTWTGPVRNMGNFNFSLTHDLTIFHHEGQCCYPSFLISPHIPAMTSHVAYVIYATITLITTQGLCNITFSSYVFLSFMQ